MHHDQITLRGLSIISINAVKQQPCDTKATIYRVIFKSKVYKRESRKAGRIFDDVGTKKNGFGCDNTDVS